MKNKEQLCRVILISPYANTILSFRGALIQALRQHGCEVTVLAPDYTPEIRHAVEEIGARTATYSLCRAGISPLQDLRTLYELWRALHQMKPDPILPYNIKPVVYGILAGAFAGVRVRVAYITGLGNTFSEATTSKQHLVRFLTRRLYRLALRFAHCVLFQNPDDVCEMTRSGIVRREKVMLVGATGVPLEQYPATPPITEPITFTLAARLIREKGIPEFAQAARILKQRYPDTRFWLLGGLDTNPSALKREEIEQWVEEGTLEWFGHVSDVRPYFAQTSVYVLPSYREGVPRSTQEAMAMGRPVITTDAPGCRETVIDGENGFLVPPRDVEALVEAMERFIQNPELISTMGQASRKLAEQRFDVHKINQRIIGIIEELCQNKD